MCLILALFLSAVGAIAEETAAQTTAQTTVETDEKGLEEVLAAYKALKGSNRMKSLDSLKQELTTYVTDGKLTQEQADLILKYYMEQFASRGEKQPVNNGKNDQKGRSKQQPTNNGEQRQQRQQSQSKGGCADVDTMSSATKQNGGQPTNNGEQGQRQQRQQSQPNGSQQNGESNGEVDTTSGATAKKGK